jgi:putative spermidine/putrescine transport system ATP-binding protein
MTALSRPEQVVPPSSIAGQWARGTSGPGQGGTSVALRDLSCVFGTVRALDGFSIDVAPGELLAMLGPSGCGKTTALRVLAGFESPSAGQVIVDGQDIGSVPAQKRNMGMVFQSYSLFPNMTVLENVAFGLRLRRVSGAQRKSKAMSLLEMVELADSSNRYPHQLSGGQQQRVALARALAIEPRVLLLDEPLSALDAKVRVQLRDQIRALQRRLAITTVFVTHDQDEALSMADRVAVMREGRLEQVASPAELYDEPQTPFVAEFVGTMNRLPGKLLGPGRVAVLGREVTARGPVAVGNAGKDVDVLARPEALALTPVHGANGIVSAVTFRGAQTRVDVLLWADIAVKVDVPSSQGATLAPGASVEVTLVPDNVLVDGKVGDLSVRLEEA